MATRSFAASSLSSLLSQLQSSPADGGLGGGFFDLDGSVGPQQANEPQDVIKVETALGNTGHFDLAKRGGPTGYFGLGLGQGIKSYQSANKLKQDGILNPGGPTISSLNKSVGGLLSGYTPPSPAEVDDHQSQIMQGELGTLNLRPARLSFPMPSQRAELDQTTLAFNDDSASALTKSSVNGSVPDIYSSFYRQAGNTASPTIWDLAEKVNKTSGRNRADQILHAIANGLTPDQNAELFGAMPSHRPIGVKNSELTDDSGIPLFRRLADDAAPEPVPEQPSPPPSTPPTTPDQPAPSPSDPEKPEPPEESDCQDLYDAFMAAQDARDAAQAEVDSTQGELDQVEAEIEDVRQQIDDAERLLFEDGAKGAKDGKISPFPLPGPIGKILGRGNIIGQGAGALKGSATAMEYLHNVLYPKRGELEKHRQDLLKAKNEAETALNEAQSNLDQAAQAFQECSAKGEEPPSGGDKPPSDGGEAPPAP